MRVCFRHTNASCPESFACITSATIINAPTQTDKDKMATSTSKMATKKAAIIILAFAGLLLAAQATSGADGEDIMTPEGRFETYAQEGGWNAPWCRPR